MIDLVELNEKGREANQKWIHELEIVDSYPKVMHNYCKLSIEEYIKIKKRIST
jgi:hypothetical protein